MTAVRSQELRALLRLGLPAAGTQLAAMMLGVVDTMMVGRVSTHALDAAALGHLWIFGTSMLPLGIIMGMDPLMSQAHGKDDGDAVGRTLHRGLLLVLLMSIPLVGVWSQSALAMRAFGQDPELAAAAGRYVDLQLISVVPFLLFFALRQYLQSREIVMPALWVVVGANVFNVIANWALIFGHLGFEARGLEGAAMATAATRFVSPLVLAAWIVIGRLHEGAWVRPSKDSFAPAGLWTIVRLGFPVGIQYAFEAWAFQCVTLLAGLLGETPLAAHTIALNLASLTFMLPMGISQGAATRVGNLVGAGESSRAKLAAKLALMLGAGIMLLSAGAFVVLRHQLPRLYTEDMEVIVLCAATLPIASAFQVFDGTQVVAAAILRGVGQTRPAAVFNLLAYYAFGLPAGATLTFVFGWGIAGLWTGLALGLAIVSVALLWWIVKRARFEPLERS